MLLSLVLFSFIFFLTSWLNRTRTRTNRKCEPSAGISLQLTIFEFMFQFCWTSFKKKCQKCPCDSVLNYWHHTVQKIFKISKLYCTTKCREKRETTINIPRSISFSPLHFVFYLGKSITFGTVCIPVVSLAYEIWAVLMFRFAALGLAKIWVDPVSDVGNIYIHIASFLWQLMRNRSLNEH